MRVSSAESVVMEALWERAPEAGGSAPEMAAEEIAASVGPARGWTEATVKTLINRLLKKGAIAARKDGRRYLYSPVLERMDYINGESEGFLGRLFDGRLAPLVSHFSEQGKLTAQDIAELRALIDTLEDES